MLADLHDKRDLGVHSGLLSDAFVDLVEAGVVTNARKEIDTGVTVTGALLGTSRLYDVGRPQPGAVDAGGRRTPTTRTCSPRWARCSPSTRRSRSTSPGQINGESAAGQYVGHGRRAGRLRPRRADVGHGRSIVALPSTARDGTISRIVAPPRRRHRVDGARRRRPRRHRARRRRPARGVADRARRPPPRHRRPPPRDVTWRAASAVGRSPLTSHRSLRRGRAWPASGRRGCGGACAGTRPARRDRGSPRRPPRGRAARPRRTSSELKSSMLVPARIASPSADMNAISSSLWVASTMARCQRTFSTRYSGRSSQHSASRALRCSIASRSASVRCSAASAAHDGSIASRVASSDSKRICVPRMNTSIERVIESRPGRCTVQPAVAPEAGRDQRLRLQHPQRLADRGPAQTRVGHQRPLGRQDVALPSSPLSTRWRSRSASTSAARGTSMGPTKLPSAVLQRVTEPTVAPRGSTRPEWSPIAVHVRRARRAHGTVRCGARRHRRTPLAGSMVPRPGDPLTQSRWCSVERPETSSEAERSPQPVRVHGGAGAVAGRTGNEASSRDSSSRPTGSAAASRGVRPPSAGIDSSSHCASIVAMNSARADRRAGSTGSTGSSSSSTGAPAGSWKGRASMSSSSASGSAGPRAAAALRPARSSSRPRSVDRRRARSWRRWCRPGSGSAGPASTGPRRPPGARRRRGPRRRPPGPAPTT